MDAEKKKIDAEESEYVDVAPWKRVRFLTVFLIFLAIVTSMTMRSTLSIAIVAMTDNSTNENFDTFDWSAETRGTILSSFFWGYVLSNIPFAVILQRYGPRWIFPIAILATSVATLLMPVVSAAGGWGALCALRVIQGLMQGSLFPTMNTLLARWFPSQERGRAGAVCFSAIQIGNIIVFPVSGALAQSDGGWPSIFYVFGSLGVLWCLIWIPLGYNTPAENPFISQTERKYIEYHQKDVTARPSFKIPVKEIAMSMPVWAMIIAHAVQCWGFYMLLNEMPTYMNYILGYDIADNGTLTALPYVLLFFLIFAAGYSSDFLTQRKYLTLTVSRKIFNTIGFTGTLLALVGLIFVPAEENEVAVVLFMLAIGLNAGVYAGFNVNHVDLSPNFAGVLMGLTNGLANIVSLFVTIVVGWIVSDETDRDQWNIVFWISSGTYLFGALVYIIFGSGQIQPWNEPKEKRDAEASSTRNG